MEGPSETLGDEFPCVKESFKVPHMDLKDFCNDYFTSLNVPTTFLYVSFYYDNFINLCPIKKDENNNYTLDLNMG